MWDFNEENFIGTVEKAIEILKYERDYILNMPEFKDETNDEYEYLNEFYSQLAETILELRQEKQFADTVELYITPMGVGIFWKNAECPNPNGEEGICYSFDRYGDRCGCVGCSLLDTLPNGMFNEGDLLPGLTEQLKKGEIKE